jgi:hypothetical protein
MTDTSSSRDVSAEELRLLEERLPWYVNASLAPDEREWVDRLVARSVAAAHLLDCERALHDAALRMMAPAAQDVGLDRLMARVRGERENIETKSATKIETAPPGGTWRAAWAVLQQWLLRPQFASALAVAVLAQAGVIGWLALQHAADDTGGVRSVPVTEVRTLRVTFLPAASESQIRAALVAAAARIVGGPTQLGEYWIASDMVSLEEMKTALMKSGVVASIAVDLSGPRGQ